MNFKNQVLPGDLIEDLFNKRIYFVLKIFDIMAYVIDYHGQIRVINLLSDYFIIINEI